VGTRPWGIALSADGSRLYTANGPSNDVSIVDTATLRVIRKIPAGRSPWGVVLGPAR
jgi:YVTN family beta-propeller protein